VQVGGEPTRRWSPLDLACYDRSPRLTARERVALTQLLAANRRRAGQPQEEVLAALQRLEEPLVDALALFGIRADRHAPAVQVLSREMVARATAYWAWTKAEWYEILQPTFRAFSVRYPDRADQTVRQQLVAIAYLVGPLTDLSSILRSVSPVALARRLLGRGTLEAALCRVLPVVESWGYASIHQREDLTAALAEALLTNRSPRLDGFCDIGVGSADRVGSRRCVRAPAALRPISHAMAMTSVVGSCMPAQAVVGMPRPSPPAWSQVIASRVTSSCSLFGTTSSWVPRPNVSPACSRIEALT
jgi:hypothetical protein